ncbi:MAG TPA: hypothetical protein VND64_19705 [Pirellulales bacterium]|nr:hypothetical protein [Pirellulales bacterium]
MDDELKTAMTSGVFVEFRDELGNTIGQAVYTGWQGRPVPLVGDTVCCAIASPMTGRRRKLLGRVIQRQFEVQHDVDGETCVWVRLLLRTKATRPSRPAPRPSRIDFSAN